MSQPKPFDGYQASFEAPGERRGMSGCAKLALVLFGLCFLAMLVTCVGGGYYFYTGVKQDADEIRVLGNDILVCQFSDELEPLVGLDYFFMRAAIFGGPEQGTFMLVDSRFADAKDVGEGFGDSFNADFQAEQDGSDGLTEETEVMETEEVEVAIQGKQTKIQLDKTKGVDSGKIYWEFFALAQGKQYPTFIAAKLREEAFPKEKIVRYLEAIK